MKKKLYILGMVMAFGITCMGCGNTTEVTDNTEAATETVAEATTEASTKEKTTDKKDKPQNTTGDTQAEDDDQPDKTTGNQGSQRTTEAANRQTTGSASAQQSTTAATRQPTTQAPAQQPASQAPATSQPATTQTTEAPTTTVCQHDWEEIMETIHHDAVMGNRCVRPAVVYHWYCRDCGCFYPELSDDPCAGANGGTAQMVMQDPVFEQYEAVPAYDEQVGTGRYRCTRCGATK